MRASPSGRASIPLRKESQTFDLSRTLHTTAMFDGDSQMVGRLIEAQADVDEPYCGNAIIRILHTVKGIQYRCFLQPRKTFPAFCSLSLIGLFWGGSQIITNYACARHGVVVLCSQSPTSTGTNGLGCLNVPPTSAKRKGDVPKCYK